MSPRQRREELKNMLLLMRNSRHPTRVPQADGSTASLLPETMQVTKLYYLRLISLHQPDWSKTIFAIILDF